MRRLGVKSMRRSWAARATIVLFAMSLVVGCTGAVPRDAGSNAPLARPGSVGTPCGSPTVWGWTCAICLPSGVCSGGCTTPSDCPTGWECRQDTQQCNCTGAAEVCDGRDNDCDGAVDEDVLDCPCALPGQIRCGRTCIDTSGDDRANCGVCGRTCNAAQVCREGHCERPSLDLLLVIDDSAGLREYQTNLLVQLGSWISLLTSPPCTSESNPTPHTCNALDSGERPQFAPIVDLHLGVVSTDLGTPGSSVPGCSDNTGDDGLLNPIRSGSSMRRHEPWISAPPMYPRPTDCTDPDQFPSFITFTSNTSDTSTFIHDAQCNAGLYVGGCGLESPLDAMYRALILHDARDTPGNTSPNAGFVRESAFLAIVMLTDEEDGSVRDCRFANGTPCDGVGALDVYDPASTAWASPEMNLRFYMYQPCGPQDPTWPHSRYLDPANPTQGLFALKPDHPERILFSAITGVPNDVPMETTGGVMHIAWDQLLGRVSPGGPDDFCGRDTSGLGNLTSPEGPISMQQANLDPNCSQRVVPACRHEGSPPNPTACTPDVQPFALPARRIVEVARRFDESAFCHGGPCHNGTVTSICSSDYSRAIAPLIARLH